MDMTTDTRPTQVSEVATIGIPVADQARALDFYRDRLGFEPRMDVSFGGGRWLEVAPAGASTSIALLQSRDDLQPGVDTGIRLTTDDAAGDRQALAAAGVDIGELISQPVPMFEFRDPDGNRLIIVERRTA
jgi:catechol 2,3-dioxygenase-like lactoylglutathione lyase family enzyme